MVSIVPKDLKKLIFLLSRFPGIGPKSARRLAMYVFSMSKDEVNLLINTISSLHKNAKRCSICGVYSDKDPCLICADSQRRIDQLVVVTSSLDVYTIEKTGIYNGMYLVLPYKEQDETDPDRLEELAQLVVRRIKGLKKRLKASSKIEVIFALGTSVAEQTLMFYLIEQVKDNFGDQVTISRLAIGLSSGSSIDFVDTYTLKEAFEGRRILE